MLRRNGYANTVLSKNHRIIPSERLEQLALVKWLGYHQVLKDYFCKNDNEGKRTPQQGANLKRLGLRPGVSDILIYYPSKTFHGLWIEMKRNKKYTKSEMNTPTWLSQERFIEAVKSVGYEAKMCYGWEDGVETIERYMRS